VRSGNRAQPDHVGNDAVGNRYEGGGRQRGFGGRGGNAHLLDDRANFIEYVRGLEQGGGARHGGGHGQPGGGGGRRRGRGGRGGNPNHGSHRGGMQGGGPRPQGNGNFGGGSGGAFAGNGGAHGDATAATPRDSSHDPDSSGNV
jgi:hypothetical protein